MITGIKIIDLFKIIFSELCLGFNKEDKIINSNYIDNSINYIYQINIPLSPVEISTLSVEKLEKIKEYTMKNIETAYNEKPKEME